MWEQMHRKEMDLDVLPDWKEWFGSVYERTYVYDYVELAVIDHFLMA